MKTWRKEYTMTPDEKLKNFQTRIDNIKEQKTAKATQKEMLSKQYEEGVEALKQLGVTDLSNIDATVTDLKQQIQTKENALENSLVSLESALTQV